MALKVQWTADIKWRYRFGGMSVEMLGYQSSISNKIMGNYPFSQARYNVLDDILNFAILHPDSPNTYSLNQIIHSSVIYCHFFFSPLAEC